jgi:hypothetical protein
LLQRGTVSNLNIGFLSSYEELVHTMTRRRAVNKRADFFMPLSLLYSQSWYNNIQFGKYDQKKDALTPEDRSAGAVRELFQAFFKISSSTACMFVFFVI